ncbi:hypothetical protein A3E96_04415 [Candidatus Uhrbacteria bacterium RIFCSPHIGHO2_12_FULL_46_13]|uniref:Uncharacterized protein n=1 Tax=Candidatus Uhrbacteria bacterium RIFCSPLOWO2_01_FULL_47_25 TaxID=1802402 RepID=A0A1F7UZ84_9BACT|nr:MAG: hypothetical protein UX68_C0030G0021 [Parcubacteria group bacterium GW2011_GWA2_46_9]OGL75151.1 MAG: hypothetical protein A3E96_04415 [Candidatus Uhrbacteria bacterium RIFCSPHIGHO2_12_FULL_46_13]OGL83047.1 MAG: hypothetical protein A2936_05005 [Candidatus Uhrbacteria bacterium RIFCSPLOWO2_01_FULL_47_25]OGL84137.1 MAG: hypothetical protein A3I37_03115 [Candidatus Uhrbacteria bacterium RIFCSPLOWO2_02_FULL_46_19]
MSKWMLIEWDDEATMVVVARELEEMREAGKKIPYIRGILAEMHAADPDLYRLVFSRAAQDHDNALQILIHEAIKYRLARVQSLRGPGRMH